MGKIYNIPFGINFCDVLANKMLEEVGDNPLSLAKHTVILPTSRSVRNLKKAFSSKMSSLVLPRIISLNLIDDDDVSLLGGGNFPQTISEIKRAFILSELIIKIKTFELNKSQAMKLAFELGSLLDKIENEQLDISELSNIVPEEFATHWQITLEFLNIVSSAWETYLKENNLLSNTRRRNLILQSQAKIWKNTEENIIIAGFSSTIPAMLDIIKTVYSLKNGKIILQGLDRDIDETGLEEINYLYGTYQIINSLNINKYNISDWVNISSPKQKLTSLVMIPPNQTTEWRKDNSLSKDSIKNIDYIECENEVNEADIISIIIRKELENKKTSISFITPDRTLARCVASNLKRWDIIANDSSGQPLKHSVLGNWVNLVLNMLLEDFSSISIMSCLKHPFANCGKSSTDFRRDLQDLEINIRKKSIKNTPEYIIDNLGLFADKEKHSFSEFLKSHIILCEKLANTNEELGSNIIWKSEFGEECANFIHSLFENATDEEITLSEYASIFALLIQNVQVRQKYGFHPRLSILGLTESRLVKGDVAILGGLNENIWPPAPDVDGWMSRPMKSDFGMSSPDVNIGLSGFDFANAFNFDKIYLTRAKKSNNSTTIKSRWVNHLEGVLLSQNIKLESNGSWQELVKKLNHPEKFINPIRPEPCPHLDARPKQLSVSSIDMLRKDPYAIYASKILRLKKLDDLEEEISNATKGTIIHKCLELFIKKYPKKLPNDSLNELLKIGHEVFAENLSNENYFAFWWPRFENIAKWFIDKEKERRDIFGYENILTEESGEISIEGITITSKADRIDINSMGVEIIDYKTGTPPSARKMRELNYVQLPIEALIASKQGFKKSLINNNISSIAIWSLKGKSEEENVISSIEIDDEMLDRTEDLLTNLMKHFNDPRTTYPAEPNPIKHLRYNDYEHLSRLKLWRDRNEQ